jgi:dATP pyrophosphohydrolase
MKRGIAIVCIDAFSKNVLLLHRKLHWEGWEFVKGSCQPNETAEQTGMREVKEETGFVPTTLHPLRRPFSFTTDGEERTYECFLGVTNETAPTLSVEHDEFRWVPFPEAKRLLTHPNELPVLEAAESFMKKYL